MRLEVKVKAICGGGGDPPEEAEWGGSSKGTESSGTRFHNLHAVQTVPGSVAAVVEIH